MGIFHRGGRLALVAGLTAVLTLAATPGWADKEVVKDARRDVASITFESLLFGDYVINAAPDETSSDITRTVVNYRRHRLVTKVKFRDALPRRAPALMLLITTPRERFEAVYAKGMGTAGGPDFEISQGMSSEPIKCRGTRLSFDLGTDLASISIPSRCLGSPRWVRVRVGSLGQDPSGELVLIDDAHRDGLRRDLVLVNGSRIRRG